RRERDGSTYAYRMCDDPDYAGILIDVSEDVSEGKELVGVFGKRLIFGISMTDPYVERPKLTSLSENVYLLEVQTKHPAVRVHIRDEYIYIAGLGYLYVIETETMEFIRPLNNGSIALFTISGAINGTITAMGYAFERMYNYKPIYDHEQYLLVTAKLPAGYFQDDQHTIPNQQLPNELQETHIAFESEFQTKFVTIRILGQGGYGCVFECGNKLDKWRYAVKRIPLRGLDRDMEDAMREVMAMASFDHPGIVSYKKSWNEETPTGWQRISDDALLEKLNCKTQLKYRNDCSFLYIQMELCQSTLSEWLNANDQRDLSRMKSWFKQIVEAVAYIHKKGKIHRDLKPSNILFARDGHLKVCDLGIVTDRAIKKGCGQELAISRTSARGTEMYMAPEQIFEEYQRGNSTNVLNHLPEVEEVVNWLTNQDDSERPECIDILNHSFMT
ncbi:hypothetical protein PMAYCL1PPCAC_08838, partial [Pristionchus mayeri]